MKKTNVLVRNLVYILLTVSIFAFAAPMYAQEKIWSLEDCISYALENNIQIKQSEITSKDNKASLLQSKLNLLPTVNANASHSYGWGRSIDLATYSYTDQQTQQNYMSASTEMTLFSGLTNFNAIKRDYFNYLASKYDSDKMRDDISLQIAAAYLQILFSQELLHQAREQVEVTKQHIKRTGKMVEAGTIPKGDMLDIQSQGAMEEVNLINAKNQLDLAYLDLLQLLDMSTSERFEIRKPDLIIKDKPKLYGSEKIYDVAITHLPEIKSAEYLLKSSERELARAHGLRSPTLSIRGSWGTNYSDQIIYTDPGNPKYGETIPFKDQLDNNQNKTLSLSLNIPIFNGYQVGTYVNQAKLQTLYALNNLELQKNTVRKNVEQAYADARAAYETFKANQKSLQASKEAFKYMEQKFNVGIVNSLDYNMAKTQLSRSESDLLQAKYDFIFKTKVLDFYMGRPITLEEYK